MAKTVDLRRVITGSGWITAKMVSIERKPTSFIQFTAIGQVAPVHYETVPSPFNYVTCNDPDGHGACDHCQSGWERELKTLLPVLLPESCSIGILILNHELPPLEHQPFKLLPKLLGALEYVEPRVSNVSYVDGKYEVSSQMLELDEMEIRAHLSQYQEEYKGGEIDLTAIFAHMLRSNNKDLF